MVVSLDRDFEDGEFGSDGEFYASGVKQVSFAPCGRVIDDFYAFGVT